MKNICNYSPECVVQQISGINGWIPRSQTPFGNAFPDAPRRTFTKHKKLFIFLQNYRKQLILLFFTLFIIYNFNKINK